MKKVGIVILIILFIAVVSGGIIFLVGEEKHSVEYNEGNTSIVEKELDINSDLV